MRLDALRTMLLTALLLIVSGANGHGLIQDPPARNWFCGAITKPDQVANGTAQYPVCGQAFTAPGIDPNAGYSFMSVLTHTTGRSGVGPRNNVCGFNSESWNGAATPWDQPINWPTVPMTAGSKVFTWNISWGPHFSDTEEFRYWITKPGFQYQVGTPLSFNDFEDQPFCVLNYNDATPNANPDVIPNPGAATFQTRCNVPARTGRHVIYAEWGRNQWTFERFHGCIDAMFQGGTGPTLDAAIALSPDVAEFEGAGSITLDGRGSIGSNLSYQWTVSSQNPSLYTLTNANQSVATLTMGTPQASANVTVSLVVSSGGSSDSATRTFVHRPANTASQWFDLGPLTSESRTLTVGDRVSVRTVSTSGQDAFWPTTPLTITAANAAATAWPLALGQAVNAGNGAVRVGVLNAQSQVVPQQSATANRVYAQNSAGIQSAFLQVTPPTTGNGGLTVTPAITSASPYYNEQQLRISNTAAVTALSVTIVVQRTTGVSYAGQYNTLGGQVTQTNSSTSSAITYQYTLGSGLTLSPGTNRTFAAQFGGTGTSHPTAGDTYTVTYTSGGTQYTQSGTF
ncbi:MAG TPA: lytic polysaccharide monooxygenase [Steroidobacter sp.]|uniref:lytic polysaccharide monooxygenase n=1 Tax=Steroidobacter sp. TaxID=1978227 RepID=UPI002ED836F8